MWAKFVLRPSYRNGYANASLTEWWRGQGRCTWSDYGGKFATLDSPISRPARSQSTRCAPNHFTAHSRHSNNIRRSFSGHESFRLHVRAMLLLTNTLSTLEMSRHWSWPYSKPYFFVHPCRSSVYPSVCVNSTVSSPAACKLKPSPTWCLKYWRFSRPPPRHVRYVHPTGKRVRSGRLQGGNDDQGNQWTIQIERDAQRSRGIGHGRPIGSRHAGALRKEWSAFSTR